jgi:hypothetical protein
VTISGSGVITVSNLLAVVSESEPGLSSDEVTPSLLSLASYGEEVVRSLVIKLNRFEQTSPY